MEIEQLRPRLWRWTATHPDWSPEEGGPDGWQPEVSSHALVEEDALVLIDPLVPADDEERFWHALDTRRRAPRPAADPADGVLARAQLADDPRPLSGCARLGTRGGGGEGARAGRVHGHVHVRGHAAGRSRGEGDRLHDRGAALDSIPARARSGRRPARHARRRRPRLPRLVARRGSLACGAPRPAAALLLDLPIELVLLAHGEPVRENAHAALEAALTA